MSIRIRVEKHPDATHAHKYRYTLVYGEKTLNSSEGYPTHQHVTRAVEGLWKDLAKVFGFGTVGKAAKAALSGDKHPPIPYTADSLKPDERG